MPPVIRTYDFIGFGDEVPGILALVSAAREHRRQTGRFPRSLLIFKGNGQLGVGGHLVRGGLSYLDRSHVPLEVRQSLGLPSFGEPAAIYQEFLDRSGVDAIALDPQKASAALRSMMAEVNVDTLGGVEIAAVQKEGDRLTAIELTKGEIYLGKQFIDATVNAELAQFAGVRKFRGFESLGLPDSELSVTLTFETLGLRVQQLQAIESIYLQRFSNPNDTEAQGWLNIAAGRDAAYAKQLRQDMTDAQGNLKTMIVGRDYIDVRSKALSIAYHSFRGTKLALAASGAILDNANIAILGSSRLSWNALLFDVNATEAEDLARSAARPTPEMLREMALVQQWFQSLGASAVKPSPELYIRHAGNVAEVVNPLSGADMLTGALPANRALGTFGYAFDIRGGIAGIERNANANGIRDLRFKPPLFNIGIQHSLCTTVPNLAVISPGSGFTGYASSAGRIVEFNVGVGQGVGIACSLALLSGRSLAAIADTEVRQVLADTDRLPRIYGRGANQFEVARLADFEQKLGDDVLIATRPDASPAVRSAAGSAAGSTAGSAVRSATLMPPVMIQDEVGRRSAPRASRVSRTGRAS
ncbi:MAG: FAD-dependent oxidoreductase [Oculatellaceae cyanobacterium Prado106]|nr:FAD-dependent oxidoreductase [Oculatellaceae cyanobacterium Prado106]